MTAGHWNANTNFFEIITMITQSQYFDLNNKALSRSKIKDYSTCPNFFYRKHITGDITQEDKQAFKIGTGVDDLCAQDILSKDYVCFDGDRRTKEGKSEYAMLEASGKTILSKSDYEQIIGMSDAIQTTTAYKQLADHDRQTLLQVEMDLGQHFTSLVAMPDFMKIEDRHAILTDLKTAKTIEPRAYFYHCQNYWYFEQFAIETIILKALDLVDTFEYRHITVEKTKDIWNVATFKFDETDIRVSMGKINLLLALIRNDKEFKKKDASFDNPILIKYE